MSITLPALGPDLPVHPYTGLTALGLRRNGDPIWPVLGAAETDDGDQDDTDDDSKADDDKGDGDKADEGADQLGDAGKKALDRMKARLKAERDQRRALADELTALKAKDGKADTPDPEKIRAEAKAEAQAEVLKDRALDKVEAKAAKLFADPEDARALLASNVDEFIDGGKVDTDAIEEALQDLLKRKPHLAAQGGKRFQGSADQGSRNGKPQPAQLTRADLKGMTPEQIVAAKAEGKLNELLGVK